MVENAIAMITEESYFRGYFLDSENFREVVDCIIETSVKRAFRKVLLSYCLSIGSNFRFFTLQEKLTKIRYSYVTPLLISS